MDFNSFQYVFPKNDWNVFFNATSNEEIIKSISHILKQEKRQVFPEITNIFKAYELCSIINTKVVIIGQDPYHGLNQANGLAFSVSSNVTLPPSLKNIYKEIERDLQIKMTKNGDLSKWAKQGVLLINCTLTVAANEPNSHSKIGWQNLTNKIIEHLSLNKEKLIFVLWGNFAKQKTSLIDSKKHNILTAHHPSPFSAYRGFFKCGHFSFINQLLSDQNQTNIVWDN